MKVKRRRREKRRSEKRRIGREKEGGKWRNVAGLMTKDKDFWKDLREWNVMTLMKTWIKEKE